MLAEAGDSAGASEEGSESAEAGAYAGAGLEVIAGSVRRGSRVGCGVFVLEVATVLVVGSRGGR